MNDSSSKPPEDSGSEEARPGSTDNPDASPSPNGGDAQWRNDDIVGDPDWAPLPAYPPPRATPQPPDAESTISFEKTSDRNSNASGPVYGAPDPRFTGQTPPGGQYPPPPPGPNQYGPNQYGPNQYGPNQYGPNQYGPNQYGPNQYGPNQYGNQGYGAPMGYGDPSAPYGRHPVTGEAFSDKQKLTAGLLGILLGPFGAGRFYLGQPGLGVAQIAVTWFTCGIGAIWPLVDGILMLTGSVRDRNGRPLRD